MSVDVDVFIYFFANTTFSSVKHSMKEKEKYFFRFIQFNVKTKHYESLKVRLKEIALGGDGMAAWLGPRHRYPPPLRSGNGGSRETVSLEHLIFIPRPGVFVAQSSDRKKAFAKESLSLQLFADFRFGSPNRRINGGNILCSI